MNMKKRNKKNAFAAVFSAMLVALVAVALVSCDNELDVLQDIPSRWRQCPCPNVS